MDRRKLAADHVGWAKQVASNTRRRHGLYASPLDELTSAALEGLVRCANRYEPREGRGFIDFAHSRVRGAVIDAYRTDHPQGREIRGKMYGTRKVDLGAGLPLHVGADFGEDQSGHSRFNRAARARFAAAITVREPSPQDALLLSERARLLRADVAKLRPRHAEAVRLCYLEDLSGIEASRVMGIHESRVCQLLREGLIALRLKVASESSNAAGLAPTG